MCVLSQNFFNISYVRRSDSWQGKKDNRVNLIPALPLKTHQVYFHQKKKMQSEMDVALQNTPNLLNRA